MHAPAQALARSSSPSKSAATHAPEPGASAAASTRGPGSLVGGTRSAPPMGPPAEGPRPAALGTDTELTQVPVGAVHPGLQMKAPGGSDAEMMRQRAGAVESIGATRPSLALGSFGPDVQALQRALMAAGAHLVPDGMFSVETHDALVAFQRQSGLPVSGATCPKCWTALDMLQGAATGGLEAPSLVTAGHGAAGTGLASPDADDGAGSETDGDGAGVTDAGDTRRGTPAEVVPDGSPGASTPGTPAGGSATDTLRTIDPGTGIGPVIEARTELSMGPEGRDAARDPERRGGGEGGGGAAAGAGAAAAGAGAAGAGAGATGAGAGAAGAGAAGAGPEAGAADAGAGAACWAIRIVPEHAANRQSRKRGETALRLRRVKRG